MVSFQQTDDLREAIIKSAFKTMISKISRVMIISKDGHELSVNMDALILFSPILRTILNQMPCCLAPSISLPGVSSNAILKLCDILTTGVCGKFRVNNLLLQFLNDYLVTFISVALRFISNSNPTWFSPGDAKVS